uniref:DUF3464 family protein n=1 Tax=Cyanothece sp. (strain PCC 7425 / ATCC 29141) TaxID=395961 RepID=B8HQI5_CYAP4
MAKKPQRPKPPSKSEKSPGSGSQRLPFEPVRNKKKPEPQGKAKPEPVQAVTPSTRSTSPKPAIPEVVSQRMLRRMAYFCGIPTLLGLITFPLCYVVVSQSWFELPNAAVVLVSLGFFGLGALGLSYGILSSSWDEGQGGTRLGWQEFQTNFGRLRQSWSDRDPKSS